MKPLVQETMPLIDPRKAVYAVDDLLGGSPRLYRPSRRRASSVRAVALHITEAPLLDAAPERRGRGRPAVRPAGFPAELWKQWRRAVERRGAENTAEGLGLWLANHTSWKSKLRLRHGWNLETIRGAPTAATYTWRTVVPRCDLTTAIEAEWRKKIQRRREGEPLYRIHLRGIQIRQLSA